MNAEDPVTSAEYAASIFKYSFSDSPGSHSDTLRIFFDIREEALRDQGSSHHSGSLGRDRHPHFPNQSMN